MTDSQKLLADYVANGSEAAFRELVTRYADLVCSTADRLVGGDAHLAEDVAQTVFVDLARKAHTLAPDVMLGGWLHRDTCFAASHLMRAERRREWREREAAAMNDRQDHTEANLARLRPILDEAINQLGAGDRAVILLRFFEQRTLGAVGEALGSTENAAQKRVSRALEKLRLLLKHRGVALSAAALATVLAGEAVKAAPAGLAASLSSAALVTASTGTETAFTTLKFMAATKLKTAVISAIVIASVLTPTLVQHQAQARLREQEPLLRGQREQLPELAAENERLGLARAIEDVFQFRRRQSAELLKLRKEAGASLRIQTKDLATLREENRRLRYRPASTAPLTPLQRRELGVAKQEGAGGLGARFFSRMPKPTGRADCQTVSRKPNFIGHKMSGKEPGGDISNQLEILYHVTLNTLTNLDESST